MEAYVYSKENIQNKKNLIVVAHYTSAECAKKILESGVIEPSKWESNVFLMAEPASAKEAESAGAKYTEGKIMFLADRAEVTKDLGTDQPKALMFKSPGAINIKDRAPVFVEN